MTNKEIAHPFKLIAKLLEIHREDPQLAKTYTNAAFSIDTASANVAEMTTEKMASIRGIGKSIAEKIQAFLTTNEIDTLTQLINKTPAGILTLMSIKGIGAKKIATIWHELAIEDAGELLYACHENRLINYKGFGEKTQKNILELLEYFFANQGRFLYAQMIPLQQEIDEILNQNFGNGHVFATGKFLRQHEIIDELEFVITSSGEMIFESLTANPNWMLEEEDSETFTFQYKNLIQVIVHVANESEAAATFFYTASSEIFIAQFENQFPNANFQLPISENDIAIFESVNIPFIPPCLRDGVKCIEKAIEQDLPNLIGNKDVKGVIHAHSVWSDGKHSIEQMANACITKGYQYLVMSDHSVSSFYANGLSVDRVFQQHEEIDKLNEKLFPFKIFKSIECDILNDGRLDYANDVLVQFDMVITSIHQHLNMSEEKAMSRLLTAIEHPSTTILAHPTGRLLLSRKGYPIHAEKLIQACAKNKVAIELNANPRRLDMDWRLIELALQHKVKISINPDAHSIQGIDDIYFGILVAQKAMLESEDNLSSMTLIEFEQYLQSQKIK
jgi:DNA polymerase (family X)